MNAYEPTVSIITVCYNSSGTIASTLESVARQSYPGIEHVIIDGMSTDTTLEIVRQYPHVKKLISEKDAGIYDAMNKGIRNSTGDIIGILNSDDFYTDPDVIHHVVQQLNTQRSDAFYADLIYVSPENVNKKIRTWTAGSFGASKFLYGWMPPHPTFFVRRKVYDQYGLFNTALKTAADYELMLRLLYKHRISVCYWPKVIVKMRAGGNSNASLKQRIKANKEDLQAWRINALKPYFFTTWLKPLRKIFQFIT